MIKLGEYQLLEVKRKADFGVYVGDEETQILLPKKQVPKGLDVGDKIEVFVYRDSMDRLIATVNVPAITLGKTAKLKVKQVTKIGAFLDWGLEKDLLLPFKEQTVKVKVDNEYLVALYLDKSERLCATMKIYNYLTTTSPYKAEDAVVGTVYNYNPEYGVFVAVDNKYHAMIQKKEVTKSLHIGDTVEARVLAVREDGKLDLSIRGKSYMQIDENAEKIYSVIEKLGGKLPYTDKAAPDLIRKDFSMSKNDFKKAVGRLLKENRIVIGENSITTKDNRK
ncbi:MAG: S1 RNA-binding domain-containing protein [Lachnospiraceae bacterium]|nr:S1 RNA-binding domain-containing protein [Lachnospiraceae bacterium]